MVVKWATLWLCWNMKISIDLLTNSEQVLNHDMLYRASDPIESNFKYSKIIVHTIFCKYDVREQSLFYFNKKMFFMVSVTLCPTLYVLWPLVMLRLMPDLSPPPRCHGYTAGQCTNHSCRSPGLEDRLTRCTRSIFLVSCISGLISSLFTLRGTSSWITGQTLLNHCRGLGILPPHSQVIKFITEHAQVQRFSLCHWNVPYLLSVSN